MVDERASGDGSAGGVPSALPRGRHLGARAATLEFAGISKSFRRPGTAGDLSVLSDVSLRLEPGSFVCIVGPSGCGKTTLLRIANKLIEPDGGRVLIGGSDVYEPGRDVAMVYQNYGLFPWQTVARNVAFGLRMRGERRATEKILPILERVGLVDFRDYYPHQISGGMQQRVGLARALAVQPRVLLMDEPFAAVDALTREQMQQMLLSLWYAEPLTVVFVTHDIGEAVFLADRVVVMGHGGRIMADTQVAIPRPRTQEARISSEFFEAERAIRKALG